MDILKECGPVIASSKDFVSSVIPIEVASTFSFMKLSNNPLEFFQYKHLYQMKKFTDFNFKNISFVLDKAGGAFRLSNTYKISAYQDGFRK